MQNVDLLGLMKEQQRTDHVAGELQAFSLLRQSLVLVTT